MRRIIYTASLGRFVSRAAKIAKTDTAHVIYNSSNGWAVVMDGSSKSVKSFTTKGGAVMYAKKYLKSKSGNKVIIHDRNGKIASYETLKIASKSK